MNSAVGQFRYKVRKEETMSQNYEQLSFIETSEESTSKEYLVEDFSADGFCDDSERKKLEKTYADVLEVTDRFNRQSVSYQLSKHDMLHSWLKYKEGFSAELVNLLLDEFGIKAGDTILDPFFGSGTTGLVCHMRDINSIGYDIMPVSTVAVQAKTAVMRYDTGELKRMAADIERLRVPKDYTRQTPAITITKDAYPMENARFLQYLSEWRDQAVYSDEAKNLLTLCIINSLEPCSYTIKSGQYLGWDSRSPKVASANIRRKETGKKPLARKMVREIIGDSKETILQELEHVISEIDVIQKQAGPEKKARVYYQQESALKKLPVMEENSIDGVITSPPYCNRYDYTRTYALELVYLGLNEETIKEMRQNQLSCTVESRPKTEQMEAYYQKIGAGERFREISSVIRDNAVLKEILTALNARKEHGDLNNNGVIRMVEGYFTELAFLYAELYRVCKKGAQVAFVNDNVRYGGEVIPVDFLSCLFAEQFGFHVKKVYCLQQKKGNSSQQMAKFGKVPLRKSITIWEK